MENFVKVIKRAGSNKSKQDGKNFKIVKRACSFIKYFRVACILSCFFLIFQKYPRVLNVGDLAFSVLSALLKC